MDSHLRGNDECICGNDECIRGNDECIRGNGLLCHGTDNRPGMTKFFSGMMNESADTAYFVVVVT